MTSRAIRLLAVASVVLALPMAAQRAGTIEVGGFARYVDFDNTLPMGDDMDIGGRAGAYLQPALTPQADLARLPPNPGTSTPPPRRAVFHRAVHPPLAAPVRGRHGRNLYRAPY